MLRQASRIDNHNREISWLQYFVQLEHTEYFLFASRHGYPNVT